MLFFPIPLNAEKRKMLSMGKEIGSRKIPEWAKGDPLMEWYATTIWGIRIVDDEI